MDSYSIFFSDRINRINRIFSWFPDETVKIACAYRRKFGNNMNHIKDAMDSRLKVYSDHALIVASPFSAERITYTRFHPETWYIKYPINPVNPV